MRSGFQLETLTNTFKTTNDVIYLASKGVSVVRFPIYLSYYKDINHWVTMLKQILPVCESKNIQVYLCIHHPNRGNQSTQEILDKEQFLQDWNVLLIALSEYKFKMIPINEPRKDNNGIRIRKIYREVADLVSGSRTICFAIPGSVLSTLKYWRPIKGVARQEAEAHFYDYGFDKPYPSLRRNAKNIRKRLEAVATWAEDNDCPVFIGETARTWDAENTFKFFRHFQKNCKRNDISYTLHAFREASLWDYEQDPFLFETIVENLR